jgi:integrase
MKKLTLRDVRALKPDKEIMDPSLPRFGARRRAGEAVTFFVAYRTASGVRRRQKIGELGLWTPDTARKEALQILADVDKGDDPQAAKRGQRDALTMNEVFDLYMTEERAGRILGRRGEPKKASTVYNDAGAIRAHLSPLIGHLKARDVDRRAVERAMHSIAEGRTARLVKGKPRGLARIAGGKGAATRVTGLLGAVMNFALSRSLIETNPVRGVRRFADNARDRRLSDEEYGMLSTGLRKAFDDGAWPPSVACLRWLALTGWRRGEALTLWWREVDFSRRTAFLPDSKTGKSMRPLSRVAIDMLRTLPRTGEFVFPAKGGGVMGGFRRHAHAIIATAGLSGATPHVLRHSFVSVAAELGLSDPTIGALVGHKGRSITSKYVHFADAPLLAAADQVAEKIVALMGEAKSDNKVIELRKSVNQIA